MTTATASIRLVVTFASVNMDSSRIKRKQNVLVSVVILPKILFIVASSTPEVSFQYLQMLKMLFIGICITYK